MPFLTGNINVNFYTDSAQTEFPQENVPNINKLISSTSVTGIQPLVLSLAASATQSINFNGLTSVKQWYAFSDSSDLSVTINGTAGFTISKGIPGYMNITLTSLSVTNSSSTQATTVSLYLISG